MRIIPMTHTEKYQAYEQLTMRGRFGENLFACNKKSSVAQLEINDVLTANDFSFIKELFSDVIYVYILAKEGETINSIKAFRDGDIIAGIKIIHDLTAPVMRSDTCNITPAMFCDSDGPVCLLYYAVEKE